MGPKLIMFDGMAQGLDRATQRLSVTRFADFTFDLGTLFKAGGRHNRSAAELTTAELLFPTSALVAETGAKAESLIFDGHTRFAEPFLAICVTLIGFGALILGGFSRFGLWRQIVLAIALLVLVQAVNTSAGDLGPKVAGGWALAYLAPVLGMGIAWGLLHRAGAERRAKWGRA
jgi:lipopolysaccharide export system permease protein